MQWLPQLSLSHIPQVTFCSSLYQVSPSANQSPAWDRPDQWESAISPTRYQVTRHTWLLSPARGKLIFSKNLIWTLEVSFHLYWLESLPWPNNYGILYLLFKTFNEYQKLFKAVSFLLYEPFPQKFFWSASNFIFTRRQTWVAWAPPFTAWARRSSVTMRGSTR